METIVGSSHIQHLEEKESSWTTIHEITTLTLKGVSITLQHMGMVNL